MPTRTIGTELVLAGEKEFNDAMKGVNSNLKNMRADMARVTAEFEGNADSMEALTAKEAVLQSSVEQHRAKVDALRQMYERQKKEFGENSAAADKYKLQLTQATTAMLKEENALKKTRAAISDKKAADLAAAAASEQLSDATEDATKDQKRHADSMEKTERRAESLKNGLEKLGGATAAVAKATAAGAAAIGAAGGAALLGMVSMAKEAADAAKAASEAGEELTASQQQWLAYSNQLDALDGSVANAKGAIAGILLPMLGDLATEGTDFLNRFTTDMAAAAGDTEKQTEILGQYIADGAKLILSKLPDYIQSGKKILSGVGAGLSEAAPDLFDMAEDLLSEFLHFIIAKAPELAEGGLEMVLQLIEGIDGENLADTASGLVSRFVNMLAKYAPKLIPAAAKLISEFVVGIAQNAPALIAGGWDLLMGVLDGILSGLGEIPKVCLALIDAFIDGIANAWDGLVSWFNGLWDNLFSGRDVDVNVNASGASAIDGSHASGLRYVPFDGYLAQLHRGEAVLPADEAAAYRSGQAGGKTFNLTINTQSVSREELDMIVEYMNRKLGDDL